MSIFINNSLLSRIFANNKPVRKVEAANADGTGQEVVFNTLPFNVVVNITATAVGAWSTDFTMSVVNNSPYDETFCFCVGYADWKSEHAAELDMQEDYLTYAEQMKPAAIDELRRAGILSEFTVQGNSSKQFTYSLDDLDVPAKIRLLRKKDNGDFKLNFYNGSLTDKYERYLILMYYASGNLSYTYAIDETIV